MPWPHCPNKNVFNDCLNWPSESIFSQVWEQTVPHSSSSSCNGPVSETDVHLVDSERSRVSRTQLSGTHVGKQWTIVDQVAWSMAGQ